MGLFPQKKVQQIAAPFFDTVLLSILPAVCFASLLTGGAGSLFGAIVNNTKQAGSYELKLLQCCAQGSTVAAAPANHQQNAVRCPGNSQRIADFAHRRQIQNHIVIDTAQLLQQSGHAIGA